jgi:hypothetical protein
MQRKKNRAEQFGELAMSELYKWRCYAIKYGALEAEADDVVSDSLTYLYSRPELDWSEKLLCLTIKCRAKNCVRARGNTPIGKIEDLMPHGGHAYFSDNEMSISDRIEHEELYCQALEEIEQFEEGRYVDLLRDFCENPGSTVVGVGRNMGILNNTSSGAMRRMRLYLQTKEAEYAKA